MAKQITNSVVSKLKPAEKPFELRDAALKGLILRVQPSGVMTYYLEYQRGKRVKVGPADALAPDQAREIAKGILAEHYNGEDPIKKRKRSQAGNYLQFLESDYKPYLEAHLRNGVNNAESVTETMANLVNRFGEFHKLGLAEISSLQIDKWKQGRIKEGRKPATVNRQMNDLRACLNKAVEWELLEKSPFEKVKPCKTDSNAKVRHLSPAEENRLRKALDDREAEIKASRQSGNDWRTARGYEPYSDLDAQTFADHLKPAILLSLNTGLRRGELLKLKWKNVDFESRNLTVEADTAKGAKTRHVRLNEEALSILRAWKEQPGVKSLYVFSGSDGQPFSDMRTSWEGVLKRANITDFRWHDLRHTFASNLVIAGVDLIRVQGLLGHTDYKMTLRYAHLAPEHMQEAVDKLVAPKLTAAR